jgi:hypothetical protein
LDETEATSLRLAFQGQDQQSELLKVERINLANGDVTRFNVADSVKFQAGASDTGKPSE